jgi:Reverse transcriptase (RNA-dependent DNA polymerase)
MQKFINSLVLSDWRDVTECNDPNASFNNFISTFKNSHSKFFLPKTKRFNKNFNKKEKWMTTGLLTSRLNKLELAKKLSLEPSLANSVIYKTYRNMYNRLIRVARKLYFERELLSNVSNLRKTWQILYEALNISKSKQDILSLAVNNITINNPSEIADKFNIFFTSIANEISSGINPSDEDDIEILSPNNFVMSSVPIDYQELTNAVSQLESKKSTDLNDISMHLVKTTLPLISTPLLHIFNKSLEHGVVPDKFKIANVIPIFKNGDTQDMNNYCPISLLCTFSKILKKIVLLRLMNYLSSFKLLCDDQFGFRPKHSTFHPMFDLLNKAASTLNNKQHLLIIFCDLKKAFDTCESEST